jgi:hypothetical protein
MSQGNKDAGMVENCGKQETEKDCQKVWYCYYNFLQEPST